MRVSGIVALLLGVSVAGFGGAAVGQITRLGWTAWSSQITAEILSLL